MRFLQVLLLAMVAPCVGAEILPVTYPGFVLWLDCEERGAVMFHYTAVRDSGQLAREHRFTLDPEIPAGCRQWSTDSYRTASDEDLGRYDRGHLVPANHLDHDAAGIRLSNRMANILPQAAAMNRGAWLLTEEIVECHRDIEPLEVWGGVLWGFDTDNDHFTESHGVRTPDYFWKVVIAKDNPARHVAWIIPNGDTATRRRLDRFLVPVADIELFTGRRVPVPAETKHTLPLASWPLPDGCDRG